MGDVLQADREVMMMTMVIVNDDDFMVTAAFNLHTWRFKLDAHRHHTRLQVRSKLHFSAIGSRRPLQPTGPCRDCSELQRQRSAREFAPV